MNWLPNLLKILFGLFLLILNTNVHAQYEEDSLGFKMYTPFFTLEEGIYMSFEEFKNNAPSILPEKVFNEFGKQEPNMFKSEEWKLFLKDDSLGLTRIKKVWGYCWNGQVYKSWSGMFSKLSEIGSYCQFMAEQVVRTYDPYGYSQVNIVLIPSILDMKNGEISRLTLKDFSKKLKQDDPELFKRFNAIPKKQTQKKSLLIYTTKFNERNPLYFPIKD